MTEAQIRKKLDGFKKWLGEHGAQILKTTNEWEMLRFGTGAGTSIIYRNAKGGTTFTGQAQAAWNAYVSNHAWRAGPKTKRRQVTPVIATLRERDGDLCFFCQRPVQAGAESVEHLVPVTHGGPNHISNLFLAHEACNNRAGNLSAPEKIRMHTQAVLARTGGMA